MSTIPEFVLELIKSEWIYAVLFASVVLDALIPALPSETAVVGLAAYASSAGVPDLLLVGLTAAAAAVIGDNILPLHSDGGRLGVSRSGWQGLQWQEQWAQRGCNWTVGP